MNGRSPVGKRCSCGARFEAQNVLDGRPARAVLARVDQHIGSDLGEGRFEQDQIAILGAASRALAKHVHRVVECVQSIFESGEGGAKLKRLAVSDVTVWLRSQ